PSLAALRGRLRPQAAASGVDGSMARLSAAKQRARPPSRNIPELRARPPVPLSETSATNSTPTPATKQAEGKQPAPTAPATPAAPASDEDQLARLLAAKQRAKKKRGE